MMSSEKRRIFPPTLRYKQKPSVALVKAQPLNRPFATRAAEQSITVFRHPTSGTNQILELKFDCLAVKCSAYIF